VSWPEAHEPEAARPSAQAAGPPNDPAPAATGFDDRRILGPVPDVAKPAQARQSGNAASVAPDYGERPKTEAYSAGDALRPDQHTIVATVQGHDIYLSEVADAFANLPEELRAQPYYYLYPRLLEAAIDRRALIIKAQEARLDAEADVQRRMAAAADGVLAKELLDRTVARAVTEAAIRARYDARYPGAGKGEEARVRVIVLRSEAASRAVVSALAAGADFATLAKQNSVDASGAAGGDLGYLRRDQLSPDQATIAFSLAPGAVATRAEPGQHAWEVIKVEDRRLAPMPTFQQARAAIRRELAQEAAQQEIKLARGGLIIRAFNVDGTVAAPLSQDDLDQGIRVESQER
jgi:peptidyl-prolyl cis-trans isomerase C